MVVEEDVVAEGAGVVLEVKPSYAFPSVGDSYMFSLVDVYNLPFRNFHLLEWSFSLDFRYAPNAMFLCTYIFFHAWCVLLQHRKCPCR